MTTATRRRPMRAITRAAADWPTIREIATAYGVSFRAVKSGLESGTVEYMVLGNRCRINPESWEQYLESKYCPGKR